MNSAAVSPGEETAHPLLPARRFVVLGAALLVAAVCLAYVNSFQGVFVMDDHESILANPTIRTVSWASLQPAGGTGFTVEARPILNLTLALNYAISGTNPWSYHATNLLIHALAALALFGWLRGILGRTGARRADEVAFMVALLWALHPLQTESVTYVVQRTESLMGFFFLATLYCQLRGMTAATGGHAWLASAVVLCALGMGTKEVMVSAPVLALLVDRTLFAGSFAEAWRQRRWFYAMLFSTWLVLAALQIGHLDRGGTIGSDTGIAWWQYLFCQARAILHYVRLAIWPHPLVFDYGSDIVTFGQIWLHGVIVTALVVVTFIALWRRSGLGLVGAWFFFILAPTSSVVGGSRQMLAEHRMYLPLAAVVVLVVAGAYRYLDRRVARVACCLLAVVAGFATIHRNADYHSELALYADNHRKRPESPYSRYNYAYALQQAGRTDEAVALYYGALQLKPDLVSARDDLANLLAKLPGREEEALGHFEALLRLKPHFAVAHNNAGVLLLRMPGRREDAIRHFETALQLKSTHPEAHLNLAHALAGLPHRANEALAHFQAAVQQKPDYAEAHTALGLILSRTPGRQAEAIAHFETALRLNAADADTRHNLGVLLLAQPGRAAEAVAHLETAVQLKPAFAEAHFTLANALAGTPERVNDALAHYESAVRLRPDFAEAHNGLGVFLAGIAGRQSDAIARLQTAVRLKADYAEAHNNLGVLLVRNPGRAADALAHFQSATRANPGFAEAHFNAGMTLRLLQRPQEAAQHFAAALKLRPDFAAAQAELQRLQQ